MKLNTKRVLCVGFAFFLICTFWQAYDTIIPKILTDRFGMSQALSGIIMAVDNILALFMLPLFGALSDKCRSSRGKRTPFILWGTLAAVAAFMLLTWADASQLRLISGVTEIDSPDTLSAIYDQVSEDELITPDGDTFRLAGRYKDKEEFAAVRSTISELSVKAGRLRLVRADGSGDITIESKYRTRIVTYDGKNFRLRDRETELDTAISELIEVDGVQVSLEALYGGAEYDGVPAFRQMTNSEYTNFVVPARQAYVHGITRSDPSHLIWFMIILMVVLVAMSSFRSPAVALMPDVVVKPLRSKANAVINLMGTVGGMTVLVLGMGFAFANSAIKNTFRPWLGFFAVVSGIMLAALAMFLITVREPKWNAEMIEESAGLGDSGPDGGDATAAGADGARAGRGLSSGELISLVFILLSVFLWYFGYNAVTSKYSVYATNILDLDYSTTLLIANAAAVVSYLPVGIISSKVGRKKTILAGVLMLAAAFFVACFMKVGSPAVIMNIMFAVAGIGWATINVNSFPMVVELSRSGNIGKYTGYYYTASMAAQAVTPFFSGFLMDRLGMRVLFPYATVFVCLAFVTMLLVRHGDSRPVPPSGIEALDVDG